LRREFGTKTGPAWSVAFDPQGGKLAWGTNDGRAWVAEAFGSELSSVSTNGQPILAIAFSPDGRALCASGYGGEIRFWEVLGLSPSKKLDTQVHAIHSLAFSPDGHWLAAA